MAPHLMRAQGAYKADKHARPTHAHTPTNTPPTHTLDLINGTHLKHWQILSSLHTVSMDMVLFSLIYIS